MKRIITFLLIAMSLNFISGQTVADFENFGLPVDSFLNGDDLNGGFASGNIFAVNTYNGFFAGWGISTMTDTTTPGYMNDFSAITGGGFDGSSAYATTSAFSPTVIRLTNNAIGKGVKGFHITNSTYAYLSMRDGDDFAKIFGGETGTDPDYFLLTIKKYKDGVLGTDSVDFYLADFRSADNNEDYIIKDWTFVDLTSLGDVDSLTFTLSSSDTGANGMNTPAYFCMDNFITRDLATSLENPFERKKLSIYPNPANHLVNIEWAETHTGEVNLFDATGRIMMSSTLQIGRNQLDISQLPQGMYTISVKGGDDWYQSRLVKN